MYAKPIPRSRPNPYPMPRRGRILAENVADMLTEDQPSSYTYRPRDILYSGPYSSMTLNDSEVEDEENTNPNVGSQYTSTPRARQSVSTQRKECQGSPNLVSMLQEQQQLLETLIKNQKKMEDKQTEFEKKLKEMSDAMLSQSSTSNTDTPNRKIRVKRDLTVSTDIIIAVI